MLMFTLLSDLHDTSLNCLQQEIEQAVEKVCNLLPSTISSECDSLVEQYGPAIIKLLASEAAPATICGFLGLCGSGDAQCKCMTQSFII